ncbi:hypothetical protein QWJ34_22410 [Saccharibacillus sp. CPCC 101409]|uniref:hypothetical protein n=1 Tax=Saccharibacillus sp. CPCC 101409 TaxID=3058041 RepID=UPI0026724058|nr:hypothetical protein [Saccharibacillus sp. CPCC 101409]MDO3412535.1 hypothetical protein [Saccharibacillus sp. CPCC 101409]
MNVNIPDNARRDLALVSCPQCAVRFETPNYRLGMHQRCPECEQAIKPKYVRRAEDTGCSLTYHTFVQLLTMRPYRDEIVPLVRSWFGYHAEYRGRTILLRNAAGRTVDIENMHEMIQSSPLWQQTLYRKAGHFFR